MSARSGTILGGRYELGEVLGYGGMAEVYLARDTRLGRQVAVKILRSDLARDPAFLTRFRREAQSAASLSHPSIVSVFDTGQDELGVGTETSLVPWIVMEYVEGRTLREVLREEGRLLPRRAVEILADVCSAMGFAHRNGLVHRDIKPANVMLTRTGQIKVMDFGIARALSSGSGALTQTAAVVGTAQYLSPEQARGENVDARSDIYSAGCLLYELLTGRPPFTGDSPVSVAYQHVREAPVVPSQLDPDISPDLDAIVLTAMAKDPSNRYQSGEAFREDLERTIAGQRVHATTVLPTTAVSAGAPTAFIPAAATTQVWDNRSLAREKARRRRGYLAIFVACIAALAAVAFIVSTVLTSGGTSTVSMPSLVGKTEADAVQTLKDSGLDAGTPKTAYEDSDLNKGKVTNQDTPQGSTVRKGSSQSFTVSAGIELTAIPAVVGFSEADARSALQTAGFVIGKSIAVNDITTPAGQVTKVSPDIGTQQPKGSTVVLTVVASKVRVPDLTRLTRSAAASALSDAGLSIGDVSFKDSTQPADTVVDQSLKGGASVDRGTVVNVVLAQPAPSPTPTPTPTPTPSPAPSPSVSPIAPTP